MGVQGRTYNINKKNYDEYVKFNDDIYVKYIDDKILYKKYVEEVNNKYNEINL
uniref:Uncharacterized protein n=1 Tax=viral metagenome TaxID=1070528 RepID=A0A6C0AET9_9ZZZZ